MIDTANIMLSSVSHDFVDTINDALTYHIVQSMDPRDCEKPWSWSLTKLGERVQHSLYGFATMEEAVEDCRRKAWGVEELRAVEERAESETLDGEFV